MTINCSEGYCTYRKIALTTSMEHNLIAVVSRHVLKYASFQTSLEIRNRSFTQTSFNIVLYFWCKITLFIELFWQSVIDVFQVNILKDGKKSALYNKAFSHDVNLPVLF